MSTLELSYASQLNLASEKHQTKKQKKANNKRVSLALTVQEVNKQIGSFEKYFDKYATCGERDYLDAYIMINGICILYFPSTLVETPNEFVYSIVKNDSVGKSKKGATVLTPGDLICTITTKYDELIEFKTPIPGRLLEINENLTHDFSNVFDKQGKNYVAIVLPHSLSFLNNSADDKKICYAFLRNSCQRGNACKFSHDASNDK